MDRLSVELAINQLDLMDEAISSKISDVNNALNGRLGDLSVPTSLDHAVDATRNREMIKEAVDCFPQVQYSDQSRMYEYVTNNLAHVRWLGYSAVWLNLYTLHSTPPYYVVGEKETRKGPIALLHSATVKPGFEYKYGNDRPQLLAVQFKKTFKRQREEAFKRRFIEVPKAETDMMYRSATEVLHINAESPHAIRGDGGITSLGEWYGMNLGKSKGPRDIKASITEDCSNGIYDEDMASFDVFKKLSELAVGFGEIDAVKALLRRRKESLPEHIS